MKRWTLYGMGLAIALSAPLNLMAQDAGTAAGPAALLKAIPADATGFVAVSSLKQLDKDLQDCATALGLPPNTIPSLLQWFKGSLKLGKDFNEDGPIALVLLDASKVAEPGELENKLAIYFASSNAAEMAKAMGGEAEGDMFKVELAGEQAFAAARGGFLVVTKDEAAMKGLLESKGDGLTKKLSAAAQKSMAKQDVFAWVSFSGLSTELCENIFASLEREMGSTPLSSMMSGKEDMKELVTQGEELALGVSLDPKQGINLQVLMAMKPDSEYGKQMAKMKAPSGSLLAGLPGDPFVFAMGAVCNPDMEKQLKKLLDVALSEEAVGDKIDKDKLEQVRGGLLKLVGTVDQLALGLYGSKPSEEQGMVTVAMVAKVEDSAAWKQEAKKLFTIGKEIATSVAKEEGESEEKVQQVLDAIQWKDGAESLGGAEVDVLTFDLAKLPDAEEEEVAQAKKVLGADAVTIRLGALGKDKVMVVFGGGSKKFESIAKLAAANEAPLTDNKAIKLVADRVSAGPKLAEAYVNIDKIFELIMDISAEVGGGIPFPLNLQNAAPIAVTSIQTGEAAQQTDVLIPMELIKSVTDLVRPFLMMGMGGGPGGADEPEPPSDNSGLR